MTACAAGRPSSAPHDKLQAYTHFWETTGVWKMAQMEQCVQGNRGASRTVFPGTKYNSHAEALMDSCTNNGYYMEYGKSCTVPRLPNQQDSWHDVYITSIPATVIYWRINNDCGQNVKLKMRKWRWQQHAPATIAVACSVFPRPMSSASTPCRPQRRRNASQLMPALW